MQVNSSRRSVGWERDGAGKVEPWSAEEIWDCRGSLRSVGNHIVHGKMDLPLSSADASPQSPRPVDAS